MAVEHGGIRSRLVVSIVIFISLIIALFVVAHFVRPQLVFRNRDVFWYGTGDYKPVEFFGDREVEGVFDYHGPTVSAPSSGPLRRWLMRAHLAPGWRPPPWVFGDIVLSDENGREVARMRGNGNITKSAGGARAMIRLQANDSQLYVSWFFVLPPEVDRTRPVRFSTTFSINDLPALPVQVTIPAIPTPTSAPSR